MAFRIYRPGSVYPEWVFEITTDTFKWPRGTLFSLDYETPYQDGDLVLVLVNDSLLAARWFSQIADSCWLLEPNRMIQVVGDSLVAVLGVLTPLSTFVATQPCAL
jgi:hypothetical protein